MSKNKNTFFNGTTKFTIILLGVITVCAIMFTWISCGQPWKIASIDEIKEVQYSNYKTQKQDEYYVFVYNKNQKTSQELEDAISTYANYARLHNVPKMYALDFTKNASIASDLSISDTTSVARLVLIKNGTVSTKYIDWDDINNALQDAMKNN